MTKSIIICIPNLNVLGGTEIQTLIMAKYLVVNGYKTTICCYFLYDKSIIAKLNQYNVDVVCLRLAPDNLTNILFSLYSYFKKSRHNIVHIQYVAPGLLPIIAAKIAGIKNVFATVHQPFNSNWLAKFFLRLGASLCNAFICVSRAAEMSWFGNSVLYDDATRQRHFTIYNGIDIKEIDSIIKETGLDFRNKQEFLKNKKVVGIVARLRSEKGHALLLSAMKQVFEKIADAVLLVIGDGPDKDCLTNLAVNLGINDKIIWLGALETDDVFRYYETMHVVAVPSVYEGFGLSAIEAMSVCKPVVATRVGGLQEIIEDEVTGYLVLPEETAFAEKLVHLLEHQELSAKMGQAGRERVEKLFSANKFISSMLSTYEKYST